MAQSKSATLAAAMRSLDPPMSRPIESPVLASQPVQTARPPGRRGQRVISAYVDPAVHRQLRGLAFELDTSGQALLLEALGDLFEKHGKPRLT